MKSPIGICTGVSGPNRCSTWTAICWLERIVGVHLNRNIDMLETWKYALNQTRSNLASGVSENISKKGQAVIYLRSDHVVGNSEGDSTRIIARRN